MKNLIKMLFVAIVAISVNFAMAQGTQNAQTKAMKPKTETKKETKKDVAPKKTETKKTETKKEVK